MSVTAMEKRVGVIVELLTTRHDAGSGVLGNHSARTYGRDEVREIQMIEAYRSVKLTRARPITKAHLYDSI